MKGPYSLINKNIYATIFTLGRPLLLRGHHVLLLSSVSASHGPFLNCETKWKTIGAENNDGRKLDAISQIWGTKMFS